MNTSPIFFAGIEHMAVRGFLEQFGIRASAGVNLATADGVFCHPRWFLSHPDYKGPGSGRHRIVARLCSRGGSIGGPGVPERGPRSVPLRSRHLATIAWTREGDNLLTTAVYRTTWIPYYESTIVRVACESDLKEHGERISALGAFGPETPFVDGVWAVLEREREFFKGFSPRFEHLGRLDLARARSWRTRGSESERERESR